MAKIKSVVENSYILDKISTEQADNASGFFKFYKKEKKNFETPFSPRRQNILLLGVDSNGEGSDIWEGTRSDTIIIVNIDPKTHSINAISIPRDSKVYLPDNKGVQKINSAHALGGINLVKKTLKETFGIKIDKYIIVHDEAVEKVVDALGGIPIYVEKPMKYHDYAGKLHINLDKGNTVLNGKYAAFARSVDENKIEIATLPGAPNQRGYISYWILDPKKTQEVINRMIYRDKPTLDGTKFKAGIMYSPRKEEEAQAMKEKLSELGFEVNMLKITHLSHTRFVANKNDVTIDFLNWLQKKMPELNNMQFIYDPTETFSVGSDFTIVLAEG